MGPVTAVDEPGRVEIRAMTRTVTTVEEPGRVEVRVMTRTVTAVEEEPGRVETRVMTRTVTTGEEPGRVEVRAMTRTAMLASNARAATTVAGPRTSTPPGAQRSPRRTLTLRPATR